MTQRVHYPDLTKTIATLTEGETDQVALMATLACEIHHADDRFHWTGFYRVTAPGLLKIGPYQGGHGCLVIPFDRGVCGAAARTGEPTEVQMMLSAFSNMETVHIAAYSHLLDTIGMPETEYLAFMKYKEMKDKYDYMQEFGVESKIDIATTMAAFGAFTEGLQLFASFAILLNFPRFGKMKGMGQVVTWSARDETLHTNSMIKLFLTFLEENPDIDMEELRSRLYVACNTIVTHEDSFIDLAFGMGEVQGLTPNEVKTYIRYIADRRLSQLNLQPMYQIEKNPLPWLDDMLNGVEHANFFENRVTEYTKAATQGNWDEAFAIHEGTDEQAA